MPLPKKIHMNPIIDMPVLDTDTHIVEPADLWTSRISTRKWGDKVLHVKWDRRKKLDYWLDLMKIYGKAASRTFRALWCAEEIGLTYEAARRLKACYTGPAAVRVNPSPA